MCILGGAAQLGNWQLQVGSRGICRLHLANTVAARRCRAARGTCYCIPAKASLPSILAALAHALLPRRKCWP